MKKALLTVAASVCSLVMFAQNATYRYHFNGNLFETYLKAPALTAQCTGSYSTETLVGVSKKTFLFDKGCGLVYDDVTKNFITSGSYTIELYFRMDTISGYRKLIDFDSLKQDAGLYNQSGKIVLYPNVYSMDSFVGAGVYQYVAITRDSSSKKMYINTNGKTVGSYTDIGGLYKLGVDKLLTFFRDDKVTANEQSKGAVAMIQISNYAMDSSTIKSNYGTLGKTLEVPGSTANAIKIVVSPNPATDLVKVSSEANCSYIICDITGKTISMGILRQGENDIAIDQLSNGLYLLKLASLEGAGHNTYRFSKQ
jgi:hypothetical protein